MRVCALLLSLLAIATPASAERFVIDLASGIGTATFSRPAGTRVTFLIRNKLPAANYVIVVETRTVQIPVLELEDIGQLQANDPCAPLLEAIATVYGAKDEKDIASPMDRIRAASDSGACTHNPALAQRLRDTIAATEHHVSGEYEIRSGEEIVLTVSRGERAWVRTISGGARGKWLTTYGASVVPDRSERMFLKADGTNGFVITREEEQAGPRVIPSVYFTWMPAAAETGDWSHGPTAGLGIDDKAPGLFAGWSATYNQNLTLVAGVALAHHQRLRGQYAEGGRLTEPLKEEQLLEGAYRPTWLIGLTFRFGDNPFSEPAKKPEETNGSPKTNR